MSGIGAEGAYGAAGTFQGLQDWMRQRRQQVVQDQQDTLFQQGQQDRATAQAQEQAAARQKLLEQQAAKADAEDMLAQIDALPDLPPLAKLGAKISIKQGKPLPNELLALLKPKEKHLTIAPNGQAVDLSDPAIAGQNFAAPKEPAKPHMSFAPNGTLVNMDDPSIAGQSFAPPKAGPTEAQILAAEMTKLRIQGEQDKQAQAKADREKSAASAAQERADLIALATELKNDPAMAANVGPMDSLLPTIRPASRTFQGKRDRLLSALALENRSKLKGQGAISDKESETLAKAASSLMSAGDETAFVAELDRIINGLGGGSTSGGGTPMTRTIRNARTGETKQQTSTDGGVTWK